MARMIIDGYGQVELNNVAFRRDGRIEAQCKPDETDFSQAVVENGMLLAVDNVARTVKFATDSSLPVALVYSAEHMYDERKPGLKNFFLKGKDDFLPRLGFLSVGDKYTTNCIAYDSSEFASESAFESALDALDSTPLWAGVGADGAHAVSSSAPSFGPKIRVIKKTTMPDGTLGLKMQVYVD